MVVSWKIHGMQIWSWCWMGEFFKEGETKRRFCENNGMYQFTCCQHIVSTMDVGVFASLPFTHIFLCFKVAGVRPVSLKPPHRITAVSLHQVLVSKLPLHLGFQMKGVWDEHKFARSLVMSKSLKAHHFFPKWFSKWTTRWGLRQVLDSFLKGVYLHFLFLISCQQVMRVWEISVLQGNYKVTKPFPAGKKWRSCWQTKPTGRFSLFQALPIRWIIRIWN